jgi:exonuclease SbcC
MLPVRLSLKGIYSYRHETVIDFGPLTNAGLFGIFGPVGSGKSTIVEAMLLALYEDSPRLQKRERGQNMMNLAADELKVVFDFRVGERDFRFSAEIKRQKKDPNKLDNFKYGRYEWKNGEWKPVELDAKEVIGLDRDNFLRAVVIPQGKFRDFIDLSGKDRTEMMKEIFSLERYDLSEPLKTLVSENKAELNRLDGRLREYESVHPEKIVQTRTALEKAQREQAHAENKVRAAQKQLETLEQIAQLHRLLEEAAVQQRHIESRRPHFDELKRQTARYQAVHDRFQDPVKHLDDRQKEYDGARAARAQAEKLLSQKNQDHDSARAKLDLLTPAYQQRDELGRAAAALRDAATALEVRQEWLKWQEGVKNGEQFVEETKTKLAAAENQRQATAQKIKDLKARMPDAKLVYEWENRYREAATAEKTLAEALVALQAAQTRLQTARENQSQILAALCRDMAPVAPPPVNQPVDPNFWAPMLDEQIARAQQELEHAERTAGLSAFRDLVQDGRPCPLCGSEHHPQPIAQSHAPQIAAARQRRDQWQQLHATLQEYRLQLEKINLEIETRIRETEEKNAAHARALSECERLRPGIAQAPIPADQIPHLKQAIALLETEIKQSESEYENYEKNVRELTDKLQRAHAKLEQYKNKAAELNGKYEAASAKVDPALLAQWKDQTSSALNAQADDNERKLKHIEAEYEAARQAVAQAEVARAAAVAGHAAALQAEQTAHQNLLAARKRLDELLKDFGDELEVRTLLAEKRDLSGIQRQIAEFEAAALGAAEKYKSARAAVDAAPPFDPDALAAARQTLKDQEETFRLAVQNVGALTQTLQDLVEKNRIKQNLEEEKKAFEDVQERLARLESLFRGNGFVQFVAAHYMHELCRLANERFRPFTLNRYEILYDEESSEMLIRDYLHSGRLRSIKTLSGGQTFQAALCLALALTTMTAGGRREFFFLDEGFGTLDGDALTVVLEALRGLRKENCTVGLISHVERLREEIGAALFVENDPVVGSVVKIKA